jgi:hypothetical protein
VDQEGDRRQRLCAEARGRIHRLKSISFFIVSLVID